jgi:hypothetical protein
MTGLPENTSTDADTNTGTDAPRRDRLGRTLDRAQDTLSGWARMLTTVRLAQHGAAVLRIGYASVYLVFLLHELPDRDELWGPHSSWSPAMDQTFAQTSSWFWWVRDWYQLLATSSEAVFNLYYVGAIMVCLLLIIGLRTRLMAVLFAFCFSLMYGRNILLTDGGDNVLMLMSLYLMFVDSGSRWSVDSYLRARRPRRAARQLSQPLVELGEVRRRLVTLTHNCAIVVVAFQMCLIYGAAGLWKAGGSDWQNGTALYYALHLRWFEPWPALSNWVGSHAVMITIVGYLTVFVQIGFPFALFNRKLKYGLLVGLLGMHLGIAIMLGLPMFSLTMIIGDAIFLPERFWLAVERGVRRVLHLPARGTPPAAAALTGTAATQPGAAVNPVESVSP